MHVLIVEDSADLATLLRLTLERKDITTEVRTSDFGSLIHSVQWDEVDAIVIDHHLGRYRGSTILCYIKEVFPHVRRLLLTGDQFVSKRESCADTVLVKPALMPQIYDALGIEP